MVYGDQLTCYVLIFYILAPDLSILFSVNLIFLKAVTGQDGGDWIDTDELLNWN
jgi:hypothetical protein